MQDFGSGDTSSNLVGGIPKRILAISVPFLKIRQNYCFLTNDEIFLKHDGVTLAPEL
jgi:hypothetical protein